MTLPVENTWPKPYLLELYAKAIEEGCIRVLLRGDKEKFKSLKAAFYRIRRRQDVQSVAMMRPEYYLTSIVWDETSGSALIIYNQLPDGQALPEIESVEKKTLIPMPESAKPAPLPGLTPVEDPGDFDANAMIEDLMANITIEDEGEDDATEL